jgi:uncharacterized protein YprB with RNaseH-like and TPR domain
VIESTFQLAPGIGAYRERQLWEAGVVHWDRFPAAPEVVLSGRLDDRIRAAIEAARVALRDGDAERLALMLPARERWRLYPSFEQDAAFLDVERDGEAVTMVGILDRGGPRLFLRGRDLDAFPEATRTWKLLVTYNGLSFDVPALEATFPGWRAPHAHVDLRHLWCRLGHQGGLKLLEETTGVGRPPHVAGITGADAVRLWRAHLDGDREALYRLAEYNLHDAVNLKALMALGYNRMVERLRLPAPPVPSWSRGDVLYDVSKLLLAL